MSIQESWTDIYEDASIYELPGYTLCHQKSNVAGIVVSF